LAGGSNRRQRQQIASLRQGRQVKAANKGAYMAISGRVLLPLPTQKTKNGRRWAAVFAFGGFVSGLYRRLGP